MFKSTLSLALALVLAASGCSDRAATDSTPPTEGATEMTRVSHAQTTCPVMEGQPISKSLYVDYQGKRIYFCCGACPGMFNKDPAKYMAQLEEQGVILEDAPTQEDGEAL